MSQSAKKPIQFTIDQKIIDQYLARQGRKEFIRNVTGGVESVGYQPGTMAQFWYNDLMESYAPHWHSAFEMIMPVEGSYLVTVGQQTYELRPGDIFLIPGGELHSLRAPSRGGRFILLFEFDSVLMLQGASTLKSLLATPVLINRSTCPSIYNEELSIFSQLCTDYLHTDSFRDITLYTRLMAFFVLYGRYRMPLDGSDASTEFPHAGQKSYAEKFNAVLTYLDRHFAEDLSLEDAAAVAGFSKFHFSRTFKQITGYNFYDYLLHRRIKSSEMLLMKPGMSISQIALQSGFSSVSTFNRTFKKLKGCTPTQYRGMFQVPLDSEHQGGTRNE